MKQQIEQLMDRLADKSLTFGCRVLVKTWCPRDKKPGIYTVASVNKHGDRFTVVRGDGLFTPTTLHDAKRDDYDFCPYYSCSEKECKSDFEILGHPILIGDVLERIQIDSGMATINGWNPVMQELCEKWALCGFTKSLQEIFDCEWLPHAEYKMNISDFGVESANTFQGEVPTDPNIKALAEFLLSLDL